MLNSNIFFKSRVFKKERIYHTDIIFIADTFLRSFKKYVLLEDIICFLISLSKFLSTLFVLVKLISWMVGNIRVYHENSPPTIFFWYGRFRWKDTFKLLCYSFSAHTWALQRLQKKKNTKQSRVAKGREKEETGTNNAYLAPNRPRKKWWLPQGKLE